VIRRSKLAGSTRTTLIVVLAVINAAAQSAATAPPPTDKEIADSPLYKPAPEYPARAILANVEGRVRLSVTIAPDGHVARVEVISAEPPGWFDEAALVAVKTWRYRPPRRKITFEVAIDFTLP
jgi:TonB family protein